MDPIGFALENYDGVGKWRTDEAGAPIDASGMLPDGTKFQGGAGLTQLILTKYRDDFMRTAAEKMLTYALGRGVEHYDTSDNANDYARGGKRRLSLFVARHRCHQEQALSIPKEFRVMIITNKALARRTFLRGLGATLALPVLDSMFPACRRRRRGRGTVAGAARIRLHAKRHHRLLREEPSQVHVDAQDRRRELRVQPDDEGARAVSRKTSWCSAGSRRRTDARLATGLAITRGRRRPS